MSRGAKRHGARSALAGLWLALGLLAGCGPQNTEVRLDLQEDGTSPCMGAAHLQIQVLSSQNPIQEFHEFGQFFGFDSSSCVNGEFRFPGLEFSSSIQVAIKVYDSTSDLVGMLATGTSLPLDIHEGSPLIQLVVTLTRTDARLGTLLIRQAPADFFQYANVVRLQFSVTPEGETVAIRSGFFSFAPDRALDPFPLIVSNLPIPAVTTQMIVRMDSLDSALQPMHTWTGRGYLGGDAQNPAVVTWDL